MKVKLKGIWNKSYKDVIAVAAITILVTFWLCYFWDLHIMDWNVPISYVYGDDMSLLQTTKLVQDTGWNLGTDRLAASDDYYYNANEVIAGLHNADVFLVKIFVSITGNVGMTANLIMISAFYLVAYVSYIVFRLLNIKRWIGVAGSVVYAFLSFIFFRIQGHTQLGCYYFVPLAILMAVWVYEDERFMLPGRGFFRCKRNIGGLVMAFLIASQGIGYWQVFSCFFIMVATVTRYLRTKNVQVIKRGVIAIGAIIAAVFIHIIPTVVTMLSMDASGLAERGRTYQDGEIYGLKIAQMLLPVNGHGIGILETLISVYNTYMPLINENRTAYIGLMGIVGFLFLIIWNFTSRKGDTVARIRFNVLSDMNMCALLLAGIGSFGSIVYIGGFTVLRCYNRISVFIAFICILAVCIIIHYKSMNIKTKNLKYIFAAGAFLFAMISVWDQYPGGGIDYAGLADKWYSDKEFVENIESTMDKDDKIFQLPYVRFPESPVINDMPHMSHLRGYIHSNELRWSYATTVGSDSDIWYSTTAELESVQDMVEELTEKGFEGIYIDRNGYEEDEWRQLENGLSEYLGTKPMVSENEVLSFFKIK